MFPAMPAGERFTVNSAARAPGRTRSSSRSTQSRSSWRPAITQAASYIEPFLAQVVHVDAGAITMTLTAFGCSGCRKLAVWPPVRWASLPVLGYHALRRAGGPAAHGPAASSLVTVLAVCALWAAAPRPSMWRSRPSSPSNTPADSSAVAMSIFSGLFNLGGDGTWAPQSAAPWFRVPARLIGFAGGAIAVVGVILAITVLFPAIRRAKPVA